MTRNWKDYLPIAETELQKGVQCYEGVFSPKHTGRYALSLRIRKSSGGDASVGLRFRGEICLTQAGQQTVIPIDVNVGTLTLPPTPFLAYLKTFHVTAANRDDNVSGRFCVRIDGDVDGYLERVPESGLSISYVDAE